jgi:hypothetical protein
VTTKHTAGTWQVEKDHTGTYVATEVQNVAEVIPDTVDDSEIAANAALISAAPDLLAACERACTLIATMQGLPPSVPLIEAVRAMLEDAILKAKGEPQ